jgi:hypothetical protein
VGFAYVGHPPPKTLLREARDQTRRVHVERTRHLLPGTWSATGDAAPPTLCESGLRRGAADSDGRRPINGTLLAPCWETLVAAENDGHVGRYSHAHRNEC